MIDILDLNNDGFLVLYEYKALFQLMDLDADRTLSPVEVGSWFKRNEYLICGQFREQSFSKLDVE